MRHKNCQLKTIDIYWYCSRLCSNFPLPIILYHKSNISQKCPSPFIKMYYKLAFLKNLKATCIEHITNVYRLVRCMQRYLVSCRDRFQDLGPFLIYKVYYACFLFRFGTIPFFYLYQRSISSSVSLI